MTDDAHKTTLSPKQAQLLRLSARPGGRLSGCEAGDRCRARCGPGRCRKGVGMSQDQTTACARPCPAYGGLGRDARNDRMSMEDVG